MTGALGRGSCFLLFMMWLIACTPDTIKTVAIAPEVAVEYQWQLPAHIPEPVVPDNNPMTPEKVTLGRYLFYDKSLSVDNSLSCASCHEQRFAFSEKKKVSEGVHGDLHPRNSMAIFNVAYSPVLTWSNPQLRLLETQLLLPLFGSEPPELGMEGKEDILIARLEDSARYRLLFANAFKDSKPITVQHIAFALAAFQRQITSFNSPYDQYKYQGKKDAISESAIRGEALFFSEKTECFHCHGGFNFSDATQHVNSKFVEFGFHNTGLYNLDGKGAYPSNNTGVHELSHRPQDMGKFRAPSLRNIALTGPYMHDGSIDTLEEVLAHYAVGGRAQNPYQSGFVKGFKLSESETQDLIHFLESLTDQTLIQTPRYSDPFK